MRPSSWPVFRSSRSKPIECLLAVDEPLRWKDGWPFDRLLSGAGESRGHQKGESTNAGSAVARNDMGVAPRHDSIPKPMLKLHRVDQKPARPRFLGLPGENAERSHEAS